MATSTVLITGAGSGLGRALAKWAAGEGWAIAGIDRQREGLESVREEFDKAGQTFRWAVADVTDAAALAGKVQELASQVGPINLAIACAGIGPETSAMDYRAEEVARVININLIGVSNTVAAVLPGMLERKQGHLVAISSMASFGGLPRAIGYCASKAGVNALMEGIRLEVEPMGLKVTTICPGFIRTQMTEAWMEAIPNMLDVNDAAGRIWKAVRRGKRFYAFPASIVWFGRLLRWLPRPCRDYLIRRTFGRIPSKPPEKAIQ